MRKNDLTAEEAVDTVNELLEEAEKIVMGNGDYADITELLLDYDLDADYEFAVLSMLAMR
jgi:hypothetical protein